MSLVASQHNSSINNSLPSTTLSGLEDRKPYPETSTEATLTNLLGAFTNTEHPSMDRGAAEYTQSGLPSPYPHALTNAQSEEPAAAEHASAPNYPTQSEARASNYSASATPTSEYAVYPASARSATFSEHLQRQYHPASNHSGSSGGMAQSTSPSLPLQDGNHQNPQIKSDSDVQIDPSIAASSPTYPPQNEQQYSPYGQPAHMTHYPSHANQAMYAQPRPDWAGYAGHQQQHAMAPGGYPVSGAQTPTSAASVGRNGQGGQVYSFVPIPGAQQHKRPRRRYEEIERMYKCGWNGCEKAYGTLNHLNAHVTMQSHGTKRTPEEFKEIRKEWKARKKEEENARKQEDDQRARVTAVAPEAQGAGENHAAGYPPQARGNVQLPPLSYQPGAAVPGQYQSQAPGAGVHQLQDYNSQQTMHQYGGYPASPYGVPGQQGQQMYSQHSQAAAQPKYEQ